MAKYNGKAGNSKCNVADAKESAMLRTLRIDGSQNGATLRTKVVRDKTKYNRNVKHKKSFADAWDFPFIGPIIKKGCLNSTRQRPREGLLLVSR